MVRALASGLLVLVATGRLAEGAGATPGLDPSRAVGRALGKGAFPWYDAPKDMVRPMRVPARREGPDSSTGQGSSSSSRSSRDAPAGRPDSGNGDLGSWVSFSGFALAIGALVALLVWFWRIYEPSADAGLDDASKSRGEPSRVDELPENLRLGYDPSDPWSEAVRRRDRGDLAGSIVCLFAHQLLTLSRLGLLRISPGRTGRQLLRSVTDAEFRGLVAPTLRLFEAAYYGHRPPTAEEFAAAWRGAEAFQGRVARGAAP